MDYEKEIDEKDKQFKVLQQTLQGMQQQLIDAKKRQGEEEARVKDLQIKLKVEKGRQLNDKDVVIIDSSDNEQCDSVSLVESPIESVQNFVESDAKLVGIISTFLNVHPFGAGLDYIWSYVSKIEANLRPSEIESLMNRFPSVFKQELVGIGANIERRWIFIAFNSISTDKN